MGSYISIVNNTNDDWVCKMGYDEVALKIGILIGSLIAVIAATIATGGTASPLIAAMAKAGATVLLGVPTAALGATGTALVVGIGGISMVGSVSTFSYGVAKSIVDKLVSEDFHHIKAHEKYSWRRTLSLWQQGTCVQTSILDEKTVKTRTLYMRPIFSGSTAESNRDHDIQWWINTRGTKDHLTVGDTKAAPTSRMLTNETQEEEVPFLVPVGKENPPFLVPVSEAEDDE